MITNDGRIYMTPVYVALNRKRLPKTYIARSATPITDGPIDPNNKDVVVIEKQYVQLHKSSVK